jgi:glycosyltransferase involved in cell wall biosynthesis
MKIAMISLLADPLHPNGHGQSVHVAELARELGRQGHHVTVYTRRADASARDKVRLGPGVTVEHVPAGPPHPVAKEDLPAHLPEFGSRLAARWRAARPDVVHSHFWTSALAALAGAKDLDIPVVQSYHALGLARRLPQGTVEGGQAQRVRLEKAIGRTVDAVIATCADEATQLLRMSVPRLRIGVVPSGVDVEQFTPRGPAYPRGEARRLLVLSRLVERHGVGTAIQALSRIPDAELVIAGGPPREGLATDGQVHRLRLAAKDAGVADRVVFLGQVTHKNIPRLLRSADLVLTLSSSRPFGMVPLEAMACGVPVVATKAGGNADSIIDDVTGLHVPAERPVEVARRIRALLADPTHLKALGIAAADRARARYSWPRVAGETAEVYQRVIESRTLCETAPR